LRRRLFKSPLQGFFYDHWNFTEFLEGFGIRGGPDKVAPVDGDGRLRLDDVDGPGRLGSGHCEGSADRNDHDIRPDGVHLTEAGNRLAAEYLAPAISSLIAEGEKKAAPIRDAPIGTGARPGNGDVL
jgi:hypothetical protein